MSSRARRARTAGRVRSCRVSRLGWLPLLFVLALPVISMPEPVSASVSEIRLKRLNFFYRFQQGRNYWNGNAHMEAASFFQSLMGQYGELPRPLQLQLDYYLGSSLHELQLDDWAETHLLAPSRENVAPEIAADAIARMMMIRARRGDDFGVEQIFEQALARPFPENIRQRIRYAALRAFHELGDHRRVRDLALLFQPEQPAFPRARLLSAIGMLALEELDPAAEDVGSILALGNRLFELNLGDWPDMLHLMLARIHFDQGQYVRSLQTAELVADPAYAADILHLRAWNYLMLERYLQGLEAMQLLVERHPADPRSLEATVLGGYILLNLNRYNDSYAMFTTVEAGFRSAAVRMRAFRGSFPGAAALDSLLTEGREGRRELPIPAQVSDWVRQSREVEAVEARQDELDELSRRVQELVWDLREMRVISAGFGSTFENPATLERLLRNEFGLRLTEIRSQILELMVRPVRRTLQSDEYRIVNLAQDTRRTTLQTIRENAHPARERALEIQRNLRRIRDYVALVASEELYGVRDPAQLEGGERAALEQPAVQVIDRLQADEEGLAFFLLRVIEEEERLWTVVDSTIRIERQAAEQALRRLGLWGRQAYLDNLERLYRSTEGIETLLSDNGRLLVNIQQHIVTDVLRMAQEAEADVAEISELRAALDREAEVMRVAAVDRAYGDVIGTLEGHQAQAAAGRLDVGWRAKDTEERLMRNVLTAQSRRLQQLNTYYQNAREAAEQAAQVSAVIDERLRAQLEASSAGERSVQLDRALEEMGNELNQVEAVIQELLRGSAWILERPGRVEWNTQFR